MLTYKYVYKLISLSPQIVHAKKYDYQVLEDAHNFYLYRIPFMEEKKLYAKIPKATLKFPNSWEYFCYDGNQYYDENGDPKPGGTNGRYPGCGFGGTKNNSFREQGKARKNNIIFLC